MSEFMREREDSVERFFEKHDGKVLFAVAHPDDVVIMLGGALQRAIEVLGTENVYVVTVTDGENGENRLPNAADEDLVRRGGRRDEELAALSMLGVKPENIMFLGVPDGAVHTQQTRCEEWMIGRLEEFNSVVTMGPKNDGHPDHSGVHEAILAARETLGARRLVSVLALNGEHNGVYEEKDMGDKFEAATEYRSQYPDGDWLPKGPDGRRTLGPAFRKASDFYSELAERETYDAV